MLHFTAAVKTTACPLPVDVLNTVHCVTTLYAPTLSVIFLCGNLISVAKIDLNMLGCYSVFR